MSKLSDSEQLVVSVRLMSYNFSAYLEEALIGIVSQKGSFKIEIVVGDDCSSDSSIEVIENFKNSVSDPRISWKVLERANNEKYKKTRAKKGRLYNFSNILENCSGKYVAMLDGDDFWDDPNKLRKQIEILERDTEINLCSHEVWVKDEINKITFKRRLAWFMRNSLLGANWARELEALIRFKNTPIAYHGIPRVYSGDLLDLLRNERFFMAMNSLVVRRSQIKTLPDWFHSLEAGHLALISLSIGYGKFVHLKDVLGAKRLNNKSITQDKRRKMMLSGKRKFKLEKLMSRLSEQLPEYRDQLLKLNFK